MRRIKTNDLDKDYELGLREIEGEDIKGHRKAVLLSGEVCRKAKKDNITGRDANSKGSPKQVAVSKRIHERKTYNQKNPLSDRSL